MSKRRSLKKSREYQIVYSKGTRYTSKNFILYLYERKKDQLGLRLGVTVTKKVGKAVQRNRIKRLIKEVIRLNREKLDIQDVDLVILVKRGINIKEMKYATVEREIIPLILKILSSDLGIKSSKKVTIRQ